MAASDQKVVTFMSHYAALMFKKRFPACTLRPVPRSLSSSCGTAAFLEGEADLSLFDENTEGLYEKDGDGWRLLWKRED